MMGPKFASNRYYPELIVFVACHIEQGRHVYNADIEFSVDSIVLASLHIVVSNEFGLDWPFWKHSAQIVIHCCPAHHQLFYAMSFTFDVNFNKLCDQGKDFWI